MSNIIEKSALYNLGYGLYILTTHDNGKDNGCIVNTVMQITSNPLRIIVGVNKQNYSNDIILKTKKFNINCLTENTPFEVFKHFGFQSGKNIDKFLGVNPKRSENGISIITKNTNAFLSLTVEQVLDLGTHCMYECFVTEAKLLSDQKSMTYAYYQNNVKPNYTKSQNNSYVCKICGYVHNGELSENFVCPVCKHGAEDFELVK